MHSHDANGENPRGDNATTICAEVTVLFKSGVPLATLTAALGMMIICADDMRKNCTTDEEGIKIQLLLARIEDKVEELRGRLEGSAPRPEISGPLPLGTLLKTKFERLKLVFVRQHG